MAVINNLNTRQTPLATGSTGAQVVKFIAADRVYIKTVDSSAAPVTTKSNGAKPSGWTDLGIVNGKVRITYDKEIREIRTGIDNVLRASYISQRSGSFEFVLSQFDDAVLAAISGVAASQIVNGSHYQFSIGSEDIVQKALLLVSQNKLDGKEWQFYTPAADLSFTIEDNGEETVLRGRGNLPLFTYGSGEAIYVASIYA